MRLYLNADSENKVTYTPDTLIVQLGKKRRVYDIQGWTDFDTDGLKTRTKGELRKRVGNDFVDMSHKDEIELANMLINPKTDVIVSIYPAWEEVAFKCDTDRLTNCFGDLELNGFPDTIAFEFRTEFYGI